MLVSPVSERAGGALSETSTSTPKLRGNSSFTDNDDREATEDKKIASPRQLESRQVSRAESSTTSLIRNETSNSALNHCGQANLNSDEDSHEEQKSLAAMPITSWSLTLSAPWSYYRQQICDSLVKWCHMCDANQATKDEMRRGYPSLFRKLSLYDSSVPLTVQLTDFFKQLEQLLPDEY